MAKICPVCNKEIASWDNNFVWKMKRPLHFDCVKEFDLQPEKYGGKAIEKTETEKENKELQKNIEENSVYVRGFSMPFGEMVIFALKWMLAMIPALILFWTIMAIFTAIFGISLLSIF